MTKKELIAEIATKAGIEKTAAESALNAFVELTQESLARHEEIRVPGLGAFKVSHRAARQGNNPQTGEKMELPAKTVPKFAAAKALKDALAS